MAAAVVGVTLALVSLAAGAPKEKELLKGEVSAGLQSHIGLSAGFVRFIGLVEAVATVGLVLGLFWQPLVIASAVGVTVTLVGAVVLCVRAGGHADPGNQVIQRCASLSRIRPGPRATSLRPEKGGPLVIQAFASALPVSPAASLCGPGCAGRSGRMF
ncbi:DoxX family protein [Streptomyces scopuliridis]|uniref:DoxX family protein n=1 Tax=Streptomyces scopuliridis TaxID=452529 RepID=UPI0036AC0046